MCCKANKRGAYPKRFTNWYQHSAKAKKHRWEKSCAKTKGSCKFTCSLFSFFLDNHLSSPRWTTMWLELTGTEESWYLGTCVGFSEGRCTRCCSQAHAKVNLGTCRGCVVFVGLERGWVAAKKQTARMRGCHRHAHLSDCVYYLS